MITLKIDGLDRIQNQLAEGKQNIGSNIRWAMVQAVNAVKNTAQGKVAYKTGTLRRSIFTDIQANGYKGIIAQDFSVANYGIFIEYGTRPHDIIPVSKKVLADARQGIIFGKLVHHPGTMAQPFMQPALEDNLDRIKDLFAEAMFKVVRQIAGL